MASYRIVCVKRALVEHPEPHPHIVGVGTGERADWADMRWTLRQVLEAMDEGDTFYTQGKASRETVHVESYTCPRCGRTCIRSAGGSAPQHDLDGMRICVY